MSAGDSPPAEECLEGLPARQAVQQTATTRRIDGARKQLLSCFSKLLHPRFVFRPKLLVQLSLEVLGERGAMSASRNGNLEVAAPHHRRIVEVAASRIIDDIAQHTAPPRLLEDLLVQLRRGGRRNDQGHAVKVGRFEAARLPANLPGATPGANYPGRPRSH